MVVVVASALAGCGGGDGEPRLTVAAAASLQQPLERCGRDFAGAGVRVTAAGSDELAAQIRRGVRPDVFAAANARLPQELAGEGLLERPVAFATNELVLAVPTGSGIGGLDGLERDGVRLVVGAPAVPVGAYTRTALGRLPAGRERRILANVRSEEPDVKGVLGKLLQGAADAAFVYRTDVTAAGGKVLAIALPAALQPRVVYDAGVVRGAPEPELARRYVDGLRDGPCGRALRAAGFGEPPG